MNHVREFNPAFKAALRNPERRPLARITYCDLQWNPQEIVTGEIAPDASFSMDENGHRRVNLRLLNSDGRRTPDPASEIWYGRFTVDWGLQTTDGPQYVSLGNLVSTDHGATAEVAAGWASLGLESPNALWGTFRDYWVINANDKIRDVIQAIALDAGEIAENLDLFPTDEIVGADLAFPPGSGRWEAARRIAGAAQDLGLVLNLTYHRRWLRLYPEVDPAVTTASCWSFTRGDGFMTHLDRHWEANEFANRIQVYGGNGKTETIFSEIADTSNGPYGINRRGDWCYKWPQGQETDPLITTQAQADARRDYLYRTRRTSQERVTVTGLVIPGFELSDVVSAQELRVTRANGNYTLRGGYGFGLGPNGIMSLGLRRVVRA